MPDEEVLKLSIEAEDKATSVLRKAKDEVRKLKEEMNKTAEAVTLYSNKVEEYNEKIANASSERSKSGYKSWRTRYEGKLAVAKQSQDLYRQDLKAQYAERSSLIEDKLVKSTYNPTKGTLSATVRKNIDDQIRERTYLYNENTGSIELQKESIKENASLVRQRQAKQIAEEKQLEKQRLAEEKSANLLKEKKLKETNNAFGAMPIKPYKTSNVFDYLYQKDNVSLLPSLSDNEKDVKQLGKAYDVLEKKIKSYKPSKLLKSFGRIATYRAIRTILAGIVNSLKEGVELVSTSNPVLKETLTEIKSSTTGISVAFGVMLVPILQSVSPLLQSISGSLVSVANKMSLTNTQTHKNGQYFRINSESVKEYAESLNDVNGALTELDKFATLSQSKPILGEWVDVDSKEALEDISNANNFTALEKTLKGIVFLVEDIIDSFTNLDNHTLETITGVIATFSALKDSIGGVMSAISMAFAVWVSDAPIASKILVTGFAAVAAVAFALYTTLEGVKKGWVGLFAALASGATIAAGTMTLKENLVKGMSTYASGGFPDSGEIFIANEAGAEMIGTIGGRTAVANNEDIVSSISVGVYGAVKRAMSEASPNDNVGYGDVYLDNTKVGRVVAKGVYDEGVKAGFWGKR